MNREGQDTLLLFVGVMVLQVGVTDLHLRYVKPVMQVPLVLAGAVLTVLAVVSIVRGHRAARPAVVPEQRAGDEDHGHDHDHGHMPRTAWLLALPLLVLTVVTPPTLGAYAVANGTQAAVEAPSVALPALPPARDGAVDLTMTDYVTRALYAPQTLDAVPVRLTGFVSPEEDGGWSVARVAMQCCAADGRALRVRVLGAPAPPVDSWIEVVGRSAEPIVEDGAERVVRVEATSVRPIEPPRQQYE